MQTEIGKVVEFRRTFTPDEVAAFASISQDDNPIHLDSAYAEQSIFKKRVVHGMFLGSMFSKIFGTMYPGNGGIYLSQQMKFLKPAYFNQEITARATLVDFQEDKRRGTFTTECFNEENELILTGEAVLRFPK